MSDLLHSWDNIQRDIIVVQEHQLYYADALMPLKHPYLNQLLPGLMLIRATCIFEEALRGYLRENGVSNKKINRATLETLIDLSSENKNIDASDGHEARTTRNKVAHQGKEITWVELEQLLVKMENVLNADTQAFFFRSKRQIVVRTQRLAAPEADPKSTIHMRTTGVVISKDNTEETVFSYDLKN